MKTPKFKRGQVVRINADRYKKEHKAEQYQRITAVWPWTVEGISRHLGFGYTLLNGDKAHEKLLLGLTPKEIGQ